MKTPTISLLRVLALALSFHQAFAQTSAVTEPVGAMRLDFAPNTDNYVSLSFHRPDEFRGTVASVATQGTVTTVTVSSNPNWTANQFIGGQDTYFMLICNGPLNASGQPTDASQEGAWVTVTGNGTNTLAFDADEFELAIDNSADLLDVNGDGTSGDGVTIKIIPFWTLRSLFVQNGAVQGIVARTSRTSVGLSSEILIPFPPDKNNPNSVGTGEVGTDVSASLRYFYLDSTDNTRDGWYDSIGFVRSDDLPLDPSLFIIVRNRSSETRSVIHVGAVALSAVRIPVGSLVANRAQDNAVAFSVPVATAISNLNLTPGVIRSTNSRTRANVDEVLIYNSSVSGLDKPASARLFYFDNGTSRGWFNRADLSQTADSFVINPGDAIVIRRRSDPEANFVWWTWLNSSIKTVANR